MCINKILVLFSNKIAYLKNHTDGEKSKHLYKTVKFSLYPDPVSWLNFTPLRNIYQEPITKVKTE